MAQYPFHYDPTQPFVAQASGWIADVFYDVLPEHGFEVRDEQIYMAFQLEKAFAERKLLFAEAGVGTGKTLAYLLYAVCYARYHRRPAIIACADESLIEQLAKPQGDLAKLAKHVGLAVDARLGKSPDQYLCLVKLDEARAALGNSFAEQQRLDEIYASLPAFVRKPAGMQAFYPYGDRKQYADLDDREWSRINWDPFKDCFVCSSRHRCGQTLSRDHYRRSADIIICSHDFYMEHLWTYEARKREGQLPLLPEHSAVVFDEGHLLERAAQQALTYKLKHAIFEELLVRLLQGEVSERLALQIEAALDGSLALFAAFERNCRAVPGSPLYEVVLDRPLLAEVRRLSAQLDAIEEQLVFEGELYTLDSYQLRIVEEHIEMLQKALALLLQDKGAVCWATGAGGEEELAISIMPRKIKDILQKQLFQAEMPIIFSSATLSVDGSFRYVADGLGITQYSSFTTASPYDYGSQMRLAAPRLGSDAATAKAGEAARWLAEMGGRTLMLFSSQEELADFKAAYHAMPNQGEWRMLYEGDAEISTLVAAFQEDESSVLCAVTLWEGLDIPGPALSCVIIWSLPFPPHDPVFAARRREAADPYAEVDLPYMLLRLRQGLGRLIRSREDRGVAVVLSEQLHVDKQLRQHVAAILPDGVELGR